MKNRRGSNLWPGELSEMIHGYKPGDVVTPILTGGDSNFTGTVREVDNKINKILVAWNGGSVKQHDPDEITLHPYGISKFTSKKARRARFDKSFFNLTTSPPPVEMFVKKFLQVYSQFFMFHWQAKQYGKHIAFDEANEDLEDLMDKFVETYQGKYGRVQLTNKRALQLINYEADNATNFVYDYIEFLKQYKENLVEIDDDLFNVVDEMIARMNKLIYLLSLE